MTSSHSSSHNNRVAPSPMLSPHNYQAQQFLPHGGKSLSSVNLSQLPVRTSVKTQLNIPPPQQFNSQIFASSSSGGVHSFTSHQLGKHQLNQPLNLLYHNEIVTTPGAQGSIDLQSSQHLIATQQFTNPFTSSSHSRIQITDEGQQESHTHQNEMAKHQKPVTMLKKQPQQKIQEALKKSQQESYAIIGGQGLLAPSSSNPALSMMQSLNKSGNQSAKSQQRIPSFMDYNQASSQMQALGSSMAYSQSSNQSTMAHNNNQYLVQQAFLNKKSVQSSSGPGSMRYQNHIVQASLESPINKNQNTMPSTTANYNTVPQKYEEGTPQGFDDGGSLCLSDDAMSPFKQDLVHNFGQQNAQFGANQEVVEQLKNHLRQKYSHYSEIEVNQVIFKFLNEYLSQIQGQQQPIQLQHINEYGESSGAYSSAQLGAKSSVGLSQPHTARIDNPSQQSSDQIDNGAQVSLTANMLYTFDDLEEEYPNQQKEEVKQTQRKQVDASNATSAASSIIDWNDKDKIERQIRKQLQHQKRHDDVHNQWIESGRSRQNATSDLPRLSEYFGAITVESLDEGIRPDKKLNKLFIECFGMKLAPEESILEDEKPYGNAKGQAFEKIAFSYSPRIFDTVKPPIVQYEAKPHKNSHQSGYEGHKKPTSQQRMPPQNTKQPSQAHNTATLHSTNPEPLKQDVIVQQNTVNNDQSCQIIVNFYNVKCQSPPPENSNQFNLSSSRTPCAHQMTTVQHANGGSNRNNQIPVNKSRLSRILNSQNSINVAEFKNAASPKDANGTILSNIQLGGLQSVALSAQDKKYGSNPLTIEDQQMIFDSEEGNSRPSDDCANLSVPGEFKPLRVTPKNAVKKLINQSTSNTATHMLVNDSHPNFGSILEKKQSPYSSFDQKNSLPVNSQQSVFQKANQQQLSTSQSLQKQLHQTTKQFFKSILYKNKHLSTALNNQKKIPKNDYSPPDDLKIQSIYNSLQNKKKSAPGYHSGSSSIGINNDGGGGWKQKKHIELVDASKYTSNTGSGNYLHPHLDQNYLTHQKFTTGSSGTQYTSTNNESMESLPVGMAQINPKQSQNRMQIKAQKIGSIISMKALRNELMSQGIYSTLNGAMQPSRQQTATLSKIPIQSNSSIQKQRLQSRNYALLPTNQYSEVVRRHFKSTEETSFSPTLGDHVIKLEAQRQNSSRNNRGLNYHNTHSHQSSIKSINEEEAKSSVGENRSQSRFLTQYSETRVGSPKFSQKRQINHQKRLIISPSNMNHLATFESRQESYRRFGSGDQVITQSSNLRTSPRLIKSQKQKYVGASQNLKSGLGKASKDRNNSEMNISEANFPHKASKRYLSPGMTKMNSLNEQKFQEIQKVYASKHNKFPIALSSQLQQASFSQSALQQVISSSKNQKNSVHKKNLNKISQLAVAPPRIPRNLSKDINTAKTTYRKSSKESVTELTGGSRTNKNSSQSRKQIPIAQSVQDGAQIHVKVINQFKPSDIIQSKNLQTPLNQVKRSRDLKTSQNFSNANSTMVNQTINEEKSQERLKSVKNSIAQGQSRQNQLQTQLSGGSIAESLKKTLKNVKVLQSAAQFMTRH